MARTVDALMERFSRPGGDYLASLWVRGELELTVRSALARLAEENQRPLVVLEAFDAAEAADRRHLLRTLTDETSEA
jgi:hypothetical protein